jgi:hypothetical protein
MWNPLRPQESRLTRRRSPKPSTTAACRRDSARLFAPAALVDLSARGARLGLEEALPIGQTVELRLVSVAMGQPVQVPAVVVWSAPVEDGSFWVGLRFEQQLPFALVQNLTTD